MYIENSKFEIGFWHPFGPHAGETAPEILDRKQKEIDGNGWTLWSFSHKTSITLETWKREIEKAHPQKVLVFCSDGKGAKEPKSETKRCDYYLPVGETQPKQIPSAIVVPHPMGTKSKASAFIVEKIIHPVSYQEIGLDWFYVGQNQWQDHRSSTFGEHLIKPGSGKIVGKFIAILELKPPYLAEVGLDPSASVSSTRTR